MPDSENNGSSENGNGVTGRDAKGRFASGNRHGPGRPKLKIEREYMEALTSVVSIEDWKQIVRAAVADAKAGDDKARAWLAKYCLGNNPPSLKELAVRDASGVTAREELARESEQMRILEGAVRQYSHQFALDDESPIRLLLSKARDGTYTTET